MSNNNFEEFDLAEDEKEKLKLLTCPVPSNEIKRIAILQQTRLLDSSPSEPTFDRFTNLASLMFNMPISLITLVDVDRVWFKSRLGVDWTDVCRNDSFDAYTVNPDSSEVFVIPDVCADNRFKDCDLKCGKIPVRFYAGAAIIIDDVRIGSLCILDTVPHLDFSLEEKENLLDLCVGVSQLAQERRQHTLNLNADRANIVVSMMHNLRTPMTSLNFASSMLATEACKLRPAAKSKLRVGGDANALDEDDDNSDDGVGGGPTGGGTHGLLRTPSSAVGNPHLQTPSSRDHSPIPSVEQTGTDAEAASCSDSKGDSPIPPAGASSSAAGGVGVDAAVGAAAALAAVPVTLSATNIDNIESAFSTFDDCFREITSALKQLNLVVDSSLNLGQAIVKISEPPSNGQHGANCAGRDNLSSTSGGMSEKSGLALASACLSAVQSAVPSANVSAHTSPKGIVVKAGDSSSSSSSSAAGKPSGAVGGASAGLYPEMQNSRYVACNLLDHIESVYNTLISQVVGVNVSWEVNPAYFGLGRHASFPDAVSLVLISSLGQLRTPHKNIRIRFHFEKLEHPEDLEFPEIADKLIEGVLVIRIQAYSKQERAVPKSSPKRANAAEASSTNSSPQHGENAHSSMRESIDVSNKTSATSTSAALSAISNVSERLQHAAPEQGGEDHDYHSGYNLLSVNKVLRTVNGGCREYLEAIPQPPVKEPELGDLEDSRSNQTIEPPERMPTQHFWIPCKILPSADVLASLVGPGGVSFGGGLASAGSVDGGVQDTLVRHYNESGSALGRWDSVLSRSSRSNKLSGGESSSTKQDPEASSSTAPSSMKGVRIGTSPMSANLAKLGTDKEKIHTPMSGAGGVPIVPEGSIASNGVGCSSTNPPAVAGAGGAGVGAGERDPNRVLRALIIEDTLSVQKLLSRWMQKANCKVTCANNGSLGLNQLTSACFDIVFIDFLMPVMLGVTTMKLFQAWMREADLSTNEVAAYNSQLLIVGMSATALESEQEAAFDYGMHFFCPKPTRMDVLGLMLEAKRLCATNEEALDMICENTGTNYCVSSPVGDEEEEGEGEGEGAANALDSQQLQEGDDRDASRKSSTKGSEKGSSGKIAALDAVAGSATDTAPPHTSASANTITTCSSGGAAVVSFASPTTTQGSQQLQSLPQSTAVTDSKSAAMWSVFRSYRQSLRNVVGSNASFAAIVAAESENEASS